MNKVIATLSILLAILGFSREAQGQVVVNDYAAVLSFDQCNNRIRVDDASAFDVGDTILVMQMKTYSVDSTNTTSFGDVLAYNGAGNYEYQVIKKKNGNILELKYILANTYEFTLAKVQIIKVVTATDYVVNQPLTCLPWDNASGKGGVLVIRASNSITLDTNIDVSGKGYSGGDVLYLSTQSCNMTDYYYPAATNQGAAKGEGIGILGANMLYGRGKITNGGGGGNNNNSGGGGGGNGGAGGDGGDQYQAAIWCPATIIPDVGGIGGMKLTYTNVVPMKAFMGGGGGAGHGDNQGEIPGGNGGGIVILDAPNIIGNNRQILANGQDAPECTGTGPGCEDDGTGGGGAGGAVLIKSANISNLLRVEARGGKGADAYSTITVNATFMTGPGGGGGGGVAWFSSAAVPAGVTVNTLGGDNGELPQFANSANGAQPGANGMNMFNLEPPFNPLPKVNEGGVRFPTDTFEIKYDLNWVDSLVSCATRKFVNLTQPTNSVFSWWWNFGDGTTSALPSPTHTFGAGGTYTITLAAQDITGCTDTLYRTITLENLNYGISDTVLGCKTHQFLASRITGVQGVKFHWQYGDGDTGIGNPSSHVYVNGGTYTVVLTVTDSSGCEDTTHFTAEVDDVIAGFTVSDDTVCQGQLLNFTDTSSTNSIFHAWNFGEGTIDSAQNPTQIYPISGEYTVRLIVGNITGCLDTAYHLIVVDSISPVDYIPSDTVLCEGQTIVLNGYYLHDNATSADWDLGDGFTATDVDPVIHAYDTAGNYNVTLTVHFRACPDVTFAKLIAINPFPTLDLGPDTTLCPNGPAIVLEDNVNVSNPLSRWTWNTGDTASTITVRHPGIYTAMVNVNGCVTNDSVEVFKDCYLDIPNAFTPNNDGSNDYFLPRQLLSKSVIKFKMTIYNRWGQEIFQTAGINGRGWDGMYGGKEQPMGVYVYAIEATFANGATESYTGNLTLIR